MTALDDLRNKYLSDAELTPLELAVIQSDDPKAAEELARLRAVAETARLVFPDINHALSELAAALAALEDK